MGTSTFSDDFECDAAPQIIESGYSSQLGLRSWG